MKQLIAYTENGKWGIFDKDGREILPVVYDEIHDNVFSPCFEVTLHGKKGIVAYDGSIIAPPDYEDVATFNFYQTFGVKKDGKWQIVDRQNRPRNSQFYDQIVEIFETGIIAVSKDNKWGFIHTDGREAYPVCVEDIRHDSPFLLIKINNKWGALIASDWKMKEVLPVVYDSVAIEKMGLHKQGADGRWGVVDQLGNTIVPPVYDSVDELCCDRANKVIGKKEGENDVVYIPPQYIQVSKDGKQGVFDIFGNEKIPVIYNDLLFGYDHDDLIPASFNGKWGYINIDNEVIVPFIYDDAYYFEEFFAEVAIGDKFGFIDRKGNLIRPLEYDWVITMPLGDGTVRVSKEGEVFEMAMDATGKIMEIYDKKSLVNEVVY